MPNERQALTDGTYILSETSVANQFLFFRKDEQELGDVGNIPMDFYQEYIINKMMNSGEIPDVLAQNISYEISTDGKCIRLTVFDARVKVRELPNCTEKKPSFFKRVSNFLARGIKK